MTVPGKAEGAASGLAEGQPVDAVRARAVRVVIVDDHALVRDGTAQLLEADPDVEVVGEAGTAEQGLALLERLRPDVALVDVNLPGMSGLALARRASTQCPTVRIIVVSAYDDYAYVAEALELGVSGYLLKTATGSELVDAVRAAADGVFVLDRALSGRLTRRWRTGSSGAEGPGALTTREADVLYLLARGLSNKRIAAELRLGVRTVEGHVSNILAKLGVDSRTEAAFHALEHHLVESLEHRLVESDDHGNENNPR
jgi:DNA-binding NarL/FixJ family response regulator